MPAERYFIDQALCKNSELLLKEQELHHLVHVMRAKPGDSIEIVNGKGQLAEAILKKTGKKEAELLVRSLIQEPKTDFEVVLAQAIPRINRLDYVLEKGTELGMTQFWLFPGLFSERKQLTDHQMDRLQSLAISAMKQCGRLWLPKIILKPPLNEWNRLDFPSYFGDVSSDAILFADLLHDTHQREGIIFFTGPESGFDQKEEQHLIKLGAKGVKLHANILRTDTASIAALSLITCRRGR